MTSTSGSNITGATTTRDRGLQAKHTAQDVATGSSLVKWLATARSSTVTRGDQDAAEGPTRDWSLAGSNGGLDIDRTGSGQAYGRPAITLSDGIGPSAIPEAPTNEVDRHENALVERPSASPAAGLGEATECEGEALGKNKGLQAKVNLAKPKAESLGRLDGDVDKPRDTQEERAHVNPTTACGMQCVGSGSARRHAA